MNKGFTLIELLISITIGMLMVGIGTVSINNFYEKQKINSISEELVSNLKIAQNYAKTNQLTNHLTNEDDKKRADLDRVTVSLTDGLLVFGVQTTGDTDIGESFFSKKIIPDGVNVAFSNSFGGNVLVKFSVSEGRSIGGTSTVSIGSDDRLKKIIIEESGLIYEE